MEMSVHFQQFFRDLKIVDVICDISAGGRGGGVRASRLSDDKSVKNETLHSFVPQQDTVYYLDDLLTSQPLVPSSPTFLFDTIPSPWSHKINTESQEPVKRGDRGGGIKGTLPLPFFPRQTLKLICSRFQR